MHVLSSTYLNSSVLCCWHQIFVTQTHAVLVYVTWVYATVRTQDLPADFVILVSIYFSTFFNKNITKILSAASYGFTYFWSFYTSVSSFLTILIVCVKHFSVETISLCNWKCFLTKLIFLVMILCEEYLWWHIDHQFHRGITYSSHVLIWVNI